MPRFRLSDSDVKFGTSGVRGLVTELSDQLCYAYTAAFWSRVGQGVSVVLGHDLRPSSPQITKACAQAFKDAGVNIIYVGALPTPAIAYYALQLGAPSVVVTGSHIPFDRNGIKFYRAEGEITKDDELAIASSEISLAEKLELSTLPSSTDLAERAYLSRYTHAFPKDLCNGLRVAVYQHSGVARDLLVELFRSFGAEVVQLGRAEGFVPIDTEAVRAEDKAQAAVWAQEVGFDILVSTDGDADRPLIADETGQFLRGDLVGTLTAYYLGIERVVTPVSSNTVLERSNWFKEIVRTKIGSPYVIAGMQQSSATSVAGYEANGGFLLGSKVSLAAGDLSPLPTRDAILPMLALLALAKQKGTKLSELVELLPKRYTASDRIPEIPTDWSQNLLARLDQQSIQFESLVPDSLGRVVEVDRTDGYRAQFANGTYVHLRPSGNAPELRCYTEADEQLVATELCAETLGRVAGRYQSERT